MIKDFLKKVFAKSHILESKSQEDEKNQVIFSKSEIAKITRMRFYESLDYQSQLSTNDTLTDKSGLSFLRRRNSGIFKDFFSKEDSSISFHKNRVMDIDDDDLDEEDEEDELE